MLTEIREIKAYTGTKSTLKLPPPKKKEKKNPKLHLEEGTNDSDVSTTSFFTL